jgi:UDP-N-acetylmuramate dehydrogenase
MASGNEIREALRGIDGKVFYDEPMSKHTSFCIGGRADALIFIENEDQLAQVIERCKQKKIKYLPVGNLTNIIVRDGGYHGAILLMSELKKIDYQKVLNGGHYICAQAGASLAKVVAKSMAEELTGLEFCAGIPGSVGGGVWMNAGAYGKEMKDVLAEVTILDNNGQGKNIKRAEITFRYRKTILPDAAIILGARFKLEKGRREQIKERISEIMSLRQGKHPLDYPNAGSIFKNLPGLPAGKLIEEMGLKGMRINDAEVSTKHANFIVNRGKATAADVLELIARIQEKAEKEKGINLEMEVIVIGEN